ncbi:MAG: hypothetical protein LIQ30_02920 [Planctomycetes bacterium]|nr:hypothetical protein [Planctomycetota bacterium]MCD7896990.1 hypothetical protein [Planctomycetaceae bacterium]
MTIHRLKKSVRACFAAVLLIAAVPAIPASEAAAGEAGLVSRHDMVFDAVMSADGIRVVPAPDMPAPLYTDDHGPSQVLEIVRPGNGPVAVDRLLISCSCLLAEMEKSEFAQDERAFIVVRKIKPSPQPGATFALFVGIREPVRIVLQYNVRDETQGG